MSCDSYFSIGFYCFIKIRLVLTTSANLENMVQRKYGHNIQSQTVSDLILGQMAIFLMAIFLKNIQI